MIESDYQIVIEILTLNVPVHIEIVVNLFLRPYFCLNVRSYNTILNKFWNFSCSVDEIAEDQACLDETDEVQKHRVCILGTNDVGKTSLVNQFLTSEYMNTYDASLGMLLYIALLCIARNLLETKDLAG